MENLNIRLNKSYGVKEINKTSTIPVRLGNKVKILPEFSERGGISAYLQYLDERSRCGKLRLTCQIDAVCSNVLFNGITEVVKNVDDASNRKFLNIEPSKCPTSIGKSSSFMWGNEMHYLTMDTQLSYDGDENKNYTYYPGMDIFNNHVLRSKTWVPVLAVEGELFNTIDSRMCDNYSSVVYPNASESVDVGPSHSSRYRHIYKKDNLMSFNEALESKLSERNGWLGFTNVGKLTTYDKEGKDLGISKVINNEPWGNFVEMYPGSKEYSVIPYYNSSLGRIEHNWEYCLTYPSSATTENIPFINEELGTLKIYQIDENVQDDDNQYKTVVYCVSKHGVKEGDAINIYRSNGDIAELEAMVSEVVDDYTFIFYSTSNICKNWVSMLDNTVIGVGKELVQEKGTNKYTDGDGNVYYGINGMINFDKDAQDLSFARVVDGEPVKYYVRLFTRLPNLNLMKEEHTSENLYGNGLGEYYAKPEYGLQYSVGRLGFSRNAYGDKIGEVVFTDDIELTGLRDNLGYPVRDIYLTVCKTNYGYKKWYSANTFKSEDVEVSHCFGKLNCGFELNPIMQGSDFIIGNIWKMNNVDAGYGGLVIDDTDEINISSATVFYGDLCEYSRAACEENVIQDAMFRFNTAQRELGDDTPDNMRNIEYQEIVYDDDDTYIVGERVRGRTFTTSLYTDASEACGQREGYFYKPHYVVPIRYTGEVETQSPTILKTFHVKHATSPSYYEIKTVTAHECELGNTIGIYDQQNRVLYTGTVSSIPSQNRMVAKFDYDVTQITSYVCFRRDEAIPSYAIFTLDGSCVYKWRSVYQNGLEPIESSLETYPFTNGCLYINRPITLFLKRQDPFGENGLRGYNDVQGVEESSELIKDGIKESDVTC